MNLVKQSVLVSILALAGSVACSSSTTPVTPTDGGVDAKKDGNVVNPDGGDSSTSGTCKPQDVSSFSPSTEPGPATAAAACTVQDTKDFYDFCIDPGDNTKCTAMTKDTTKANCLKCLSTPETATKWGALVSDDQNLVRNNIAGCLQIKGDKACADATAQSSECARFVCPDTVCPVPSGDKAALNALNKCLSDSAKTTCKTYADKANACGTPDSAAYAACTADANSTNGFRDTYVKVANAICVNGN